MKSRRYLLITFDLDDTLWELRPVLERAELKVSEWLDQHCPAVAARFDRRSLLELRMRLLGERPELRHDVSELRREAMSRAMSECGLSAERARQLAESAFEIFLDARHEVEPFDEVEECLARLQGSYALGALTNGNADIFRLGLGRYFSFAFRAEDVGASKPDPRHFEAALRVAGIEASRMLHVGDHPEHDILAAQRLGIDTVWFNRSGAPWSAELLPDAEFSRFCELPALIEQMQAD